MGGRMVPDLAQTDLNRSFLEFLKENVERRV